MKSTDRILARRYSKAYDALSADNQAAARACAQLHTAAATLKQADGYMQDPAVSSADKIAFVQAVCGANPQVAGFLSVLLQAKRYHLLDACVVELKQLLDDRCGVVRPQVETAFELTAAQKKQVEETLSRFTGKTAQAQFSVRPEVLGGLKARVGDLLLDGTLQGQFTKLQEELTK